MLSQQKKTFLRYQRNLFIELVLDVSNKLSLFEYGFVVYEKMIF